VEFETAEREVWVFKTDGRITRFADTPMKLAAKW
jgi:hypothetical protein